MNDRDRNTTVNVVSAWVFRCKQLHRNVKIDSAKIDM